MHAVVLQIARSSLLDCSAIDQEEIIAQNVTQKPFAFSSPNVVSF